MGKRRKGFKPQEVSVLDSDDERAYNKIEDPDTAARDYIYDDIDEFHAGRDKVLLEAGVGYGQGDDSDEQEEVLSVVSDDDDDDDLVSDEDLAAQYRTHIQRYKRQKMKEKMGSDLEDEEEEEKENKGWGKKTSRFYGADIDDFVDLADGSDNDEKKAMLEEKEALSIQKKMVEEMDEEDFGLDEFKVTGKKEEKTLKEEKIVTDLSKLSKREKLELLKKDSPELMTLIDDFKSKLTEVKDTLLPLFNLVKDGKIVGKAAEYVRVKFHLNLNYCVNISFYLMLKAKHIPTVNHPVIKRLVQFRKLTKELEPVDKKLRKEVEVILGKLQKGEEVNFAPESVEKPEFKRRQVKTQVRERVEERRQAMDSDSDVENTNVGLKTKNEKRKNKTDVTESEKAALEFYDMLKKKKKKPDDDEEDADLEKAFKVASGEYAENGEELDEDGKRAITNQIQKNRGLTPSRKRELKNPRVRHRHKFRKAKIRRRGQVREVKTESKRYGGEMSGIRAGVMRSRKLK